MCFTMLYQENPLCNLLICDEPVSYGEKIEENG